VGAPR